MGAPLGGGRTARWSGVCLCGAFLLALFAVVTPSWLVQPEFRYTSNSGMSTIGSGGFAVSASNKPWSCSASGANPDACIVPGAWFRLSDFNNTLCQGTNYDLVGKYGFCTKKDGSVQLPAHMLGMQILGSLAVAFLFIASILAVCSMAAGQASALCAGLLSLVAFTVSLACLLLVVEYPWYKSLRGGGSMPFITDSRSCGQERCIFIVDNAVAGYGVSFICMTVACAISCAAALALCCAARFMSPSSLNEDDVESFGEYGSGAPYHKYVYDTPFEH